MPRRLTGVDGKESYKGNDTMSNSTRSERYLQKLTWEGKRKVDGAKANRDIQGLQIGVSSLDENGRTVDWESYERSDIPADERPRSHL